MALGWAVYLRRYAAEDALLAVPLDKLSKAPLVAKWDVGFFDSMDWIRELERRREAILVCANGYPLSYLLSVAALRPIFLQGPPGLATPRGWHPRDRFDRALLESLDGNELLYLEAWDKS